LLSDHLGIRSAGQTPKQPQDPQRKSLRSVPQLLGPAFRPGFHLIASANVFQLLSYPMAHLPDS
jgi:hypothetical protein